jgi:ribulose bisphosphate carboxylase small subunit
MVTFHGQVQYLLHLWKDGIEHKEKNLSKGFFWSKILQIHLIVHLCKLTYTHILATAAFF